MISFVWPAGKPMLAGTGGSETYTAGQVRELIRRGYEAQIITIGRKAQKSKKDFNDIPFTNLKNINEISKIEGTIVYVNKPYSIKTTSKAVVIFHCATSKIANRNRVRELVKNMTVIATSHYNAKEFAKFLKIPFENIYIVLPFADPRFGEIKRDNKPGKPKIVYAGRLHPEKGIYTVIDLLKRKDFPSDKLDVNIVAAGQHEAIGKVIANILKRHPLARILAPRKNVQSMAELLSKTDILLMPSVYKEPFGMLSVEAQHAGCRVIASNIGGLPETDCGLLELVQPRNLKQFLSAIYQAIENGEPKKAERNKAIKLFTLTASVDSLLKVFKAEKLSL